MISIEFLQEAANKNQTTLQNVAREYAQLIFLARLYQLDGSEEIYFKGGTALRLVYGSPRFSEDLDFTAPSLTKCSAYESLVQEALLVLEREGFGVEIVESKTTSGGCIVIFELKARNLSFSLKTDVSLRQTPLVTGEVSLVVSEIYPAFTVHILILEQLVEEKLAALFTRQKARDFFDIYFLLRRRLGHQIIAKEKTRILNLLEKQNSSFFKDLEPFLPLSQRRLAVQLSDLLKKELERF